MHMTSVPARCSYAATRPTGLVSQEDPMQLVEASSFAVRSAVIQLRRPDTPLGFVLFPMIHLATPAFYAEVIPASPAASSSSPRVVRGSSGPQVHKPSR
jgi:hypothetical protein